MFFLSIKWIITWLGDDALVYECKTRRLIGKWLNVARTFICTAKKTSYLADPCTYQ